MKKDNTEIITVQLDKKYSRMLRDHCKLMNVDIGLASQALIETCLDHFNTKSGKEALNVIIKRTKPKN